jgi:hypothetical protein
MAAITMNEQGNLLAYDRKSGKLLAQVLRSTCRKNGEYRLSWSVFFMDTARQNCEEQWIFSTRAAALDALKKL